MDMLFMGAMILIVLPLFLIISARMIARSGFGKTVAGKMLELVFYIFAGLSMLGLVVFISEVLT